MSVAASRDHGPFRPHRARLPAERFRVEEFARWNDEHRRCVLAVVHDPRFTDPCVVVSVFKRHPIPYRYFLRPGVFDALERAIDLARRGVARDRAEVIPCGSRTVELWTMRDGSIRGSNYDADGTYRGHFAIPANILGALEGAIKTAREWARQSE